VWLFTAEAPPEEAKDDDLEGLEGDDAPSRMGERLSKSSVFSKAQLFFLLGKLGLWVCCGLGLAVEAEAEMDEFTAEPPPEGDKDDDLEGLEGDDAPSRMGERCSSTVLFQI
jgi:hypothetical protein